jgi:WD40 repeat protein
VKYEGGEVQLPFQIGNQDEASWFSAGALSSDGARIAAGAGRAIYVWDAKSARLLKKVDWSGERIASLCFSHDNQMLVTAAGKTIQAFAIRSGNGD